MEKYGYRFSAGPWNISTGADPFGPPVRPEIPLAEKFVILKQLGFDAVQFHDDDAVPDLDALSADQIRRTARETRQKLADHGLDAEFVAPRLWENPLTVDGAFTANAPEVRAYALERTRKAIDIAREMGTSLMVIWLAREGTYIREAKDAVVATERLVQALNALLEYDPELRIAIEPKPNEPMDLSYIPTIGHAIALGMRTHAPARMGALVESAHALLAGLDPSDEMAFALSFDKLWSVHLNDQNSLKFDQDRAFGTVNLRAAFNQARVLDRHDFYDRGMIGVDVKALRTQAPEVATKHLRNSLELFLRLVELVRSLDQAKVDALIAARDYEELDLLILNHLIGCP